MTPPKANSVAQTPFGFTRLLRIRRRHGHDAIATDYLLCSIAAIAKSYIIANLRTH